MKRCTIVAEILSQSSTIQAMYARMFVSNPVSARLHVGRSIPIIGLEEMDK